MNVAVPSTSSPSSSAADTFTVCALLQLLVVNVSVFWLPAVLGFVSTVRSVSPPLLRVIVTVTPAVGFVASFTVQVAEPPSGTADGVSAVSVNAAASGVPVAVSDQAPSPVALTAATRTVYSVSSVSESRVAEVVVTVVWRLVASQLWALVFHCTL